MVDIQKKIQSIAILINKYNDLYYNQNISLITDAEYDQLCSTYRQLLSEHPEIIINNSPHNSVGANITKYHSKEN